MIVLAHRANRVGPCEKEENTLAAVRVCLQRGWGVEIDIRRTTSGKFYVSHDPTKHSSSNDARPYCRLIRTCARAPIALNVKELGYEQALVDLLSEERILDRVFLFDMELIELRRGETARRFRQYCPGVRVAMRVSDRGEPVEWALEQGSPEIVWLDEFDSLWANRTDIAVLKCAGKRIFAVSPEIHGFSKQQMLRRWQEFSEWGVDGICTDHPEKLQAYIEARSMENSKLLQWEG